MLNASVCYLIAQSPSAHGAFDQPLETLKERMCEVRSVRATDKYAALAAGLNPEWVLVLADYADYEGERLVQYGGERYRIIRTYVNRQEIELTIERCRE